MKTIAFTIEMSPVYNVPCTPVYDVPCGKKVEKKTTVSYTIVCTHEELEDLFSDLGSDLGSEELKVTDFTLSATSYGETASGEPQVRVNASFTTVCSNEIIRDVISMLTDALGDEDEEEEEEEEEE